jgi:dienelactone hydrolase
MKRSRLLKSATMATAVAVLIVSGLATGRAEAAIGPDPTDAILLAARGPFAISQARAPAIGFGGGTIYYPTDPSLGRLGAVVVVPGFTALESSIAVYGPRLASHGFVVLTINTNTVFDFPAQRANQQNAAFRYLTTSSPVAGRIDGTRLAAAGWSMGGGGSLIAAQSNANIKVVVPMAPWSPGSSFRYAKPTFILSCASDTIATNGSNSNLFYASLTGEKAQLTVPGSHFCPGTPSNQVIRLMVSWLKRFLDGDTRYSRFICSGTPVGAVSYRNTCPV